MKALALALALLCLAAAPRAAAAADAPGTDLVTPAGRIFHRFAAGPAAAGDRSRGVLLTYATLARDRAALARDAEALVAAVGPELAASGQARLLVRASTAAGEGLGFELKGGRWQGEGGKTPAGAPPPASAEDLKAVARTAAAAAAGARWLGHLDRAQPREAVAEAATSFRMEIEATDQWNTLLGQRQALRGPERREELYRFQALTGSARQAWVITVQYRTRSLDGAYFLERVTLLEEGGAWKVAGYGVRPEVAPAPGR